MDEVGVSRPDGWKQNVLLAAGPRVLSLRFAHLRSRGREVKLRPNTRRPGRQKPIERVLQLEALGVQTPEVLDVKDQAHTGTLMYFEHVGGAVTEIIVLQHKAPRHFGGQTLPGCAPAINSTCLIAIGTARMDDENGF